MAKTWEDRERPTATRTTSAPPVRNLKANGQSVLGLRGALDAELSGGRRQVRCLRSCQQLHHRANSDKLCQPEAVLPPLFGVALKALLRGLKPRPQPPVTRGRAEHLYE